MPNANHTCPTCGNPLTLRHGRRGDFWGCSTYPKCRVALKCGEDGTPIIPPDTGERCEQCGAPMVIMHSSRGEFLACSTYPHCRFTKVIKHEP